MKTNRCICCGTYYTLIHKEKIMSGENCACTKITTCAYHSWCPEPVTLVEKEVTVGKPNRDFIIKSAEQLYEEYVAHCREQKLPKFAPRFCSSCGKDVFDPSHVELYPTGCPYCQKSFVG